MKRFVQYVWKLLWKEEEDESEYLFVDIYFMKDVLKGGLSSGNVVRSVGGELNFCIIHKTQTKRRETPSTRYLTIFQPSWTHPTHCYVH